MTFPPACGILDAICIYRRSLPLKKLYDGVQRFCASHPRFGIPNLMRVIVAGNVAVYILMLLTQANDANALSSTARCGASSPSFSCPATPPPCPC